MRISDWSSDVCSSDLSWRGLTGSYPSRLYLLPLQQVVDEYTRFELPGLVSIPRRLDDTEIAGRLERAARVHWSYDGRYRFITNTCAVETYKLLHDGVPRLAGAGLSSITPNGLLRRFARAGVADPTMLDDPDEALRQGYYFSPASAHFQAMFEVADDALHLPAGDVPALLEFSSTAPSHWPGRGGAGVYKTTPIVWRRRLARAGCAEPTRLVVPGGAVPEGYDCKPSGAQYQGWLEVAGGALQRPAGVVQEWLELAATERAPWLERGELRASAALLLLEEAALRREELLARDELKRLLLGRHAKDDADSADTRARLEIGRAHV